MTFWRLLHILVSGDDHAQPQSIQRGFSTQIAKHLSGCMCVYVCLPGESSQLWRKHTINYKHWMENIITLPCQAKGIIMHPSINSNPAYWNIGRSFGCCCLLVTKVSNSPLWWSSQRDFMGTVECGFFAASETVLLSCFLWGPSKTECAATVGKECNFFDPPGQQ